MYQSSYRNQEYRQQDVMGASPMRLIIMAYDLAIMACEKKNFEKAAKTVGVLRDALNYDYPEVSVGLLRLYQWCLDCIRKGDFSSASNTLKELRSAWVESEKQLMVGPGDGIFSTSKQEFASLGRNA